MVPRPDPLRWERYFADAFAHFYADFIVREQEKMRGACADSYATKSLVLVRQ